MASWDYPRTEEHNRHISEAKRKYYSNPSNIAKSKEAHKHIVRKVDMSQECVKVKGVLYYLFDCVDCGEPHYSQKVKGQPTSSRCLSCAAKIRGRGRVFTKETKAKISASLMGHEVSDKSRNPFWLWSEESRRKLGLAKRGKPSGKKGWKAPPETIERMRIAGKKVWTHYSIETLQKMLQSHVGWQNYNKLEARLDNILQGILSSQYRYNGGGQLGFRIYYHIPDFVNVNGQKKIIEFNGCFWHCCEHCNITRHPMGKPVQDVRARDKQNIINAEQLGYKVLTIWEHEMDNKSSVIERVVAFNNE